METADEKNPISPTAPASVWKLGGMSLRVLMGRVWQEIYAGSLLTHAAALSFYFLLALFPLLLFLITILGFLTDSGNDMRASLLSYLSRIAPPAASTLVYATVDEIAQNADSGKLSFGLLSALWVASSGVAALAESLNAMYGVKESRPYWRTRLLSIGLTVAIIVLIVTPLMLMLYGGEIGEAIADYFNQGSLFITLWSVLQIPIALAFVLFSFALIYYFAPNVNEQKWYWITPGSIAGVLLWLLVSILFRVYLRHFDSYSLTYGSLGAVVVLSLWFYLTGTAILLGGKINAEIENAAAKAGMPDAKRHGEKEAQEN
ncbi:MAG: YihY/virulence factor BrkB family protein [Acidobacteriota bacterium]|nr:YihY/virulence factor BrkB family protein [Acidobacteriota bacterium]